MIEGVKLESGHYGCRASITSAWSDQMAKYLKAHDVVELELNMAKRWSGNDLSFLSELPHLQSFEILDLRPAIRNINPIHFLHELKRLGVTTYCSTEIRFIEFPKLESCGLEWGKRKAHSIFDCKTLKKLFVNRYKGKDTISFARLSNLESLSILNAPIENLQGLKALEKLRYLRLANLKRLFSLGGIERLVSLEELEIHTCRGVSSIVEIGFLSRLQKLYLNNDGDIDSFRPLDNLHNLEAVIFYESTNIVDGDLSPLLRQKKLSRVSFKNRRHYSNRREEFGKAHSG